MNGEEEKEEPKIPRRKGSSDFPNTGEDGGPGKDPYI
jgi:hypothetical protein